MVHKKTQLKIKRRNRMSVQEITSPHNAQRFLTVVKDQYALWQILGIWLAASAPSVCCIAAITVATCAHRRGPEALLALRPSEIDNGVFQADQKYSSLFEGFFHNHLQSLSPSI
jgi:hypothetical protein